MSPQKKCPMYDLCPVFKDAMIPEDVRERNHRIIADQYCAESYTLCCRYKLKVLNNIKPAPDVMPWSQSKMDEILAGAGE